MTLLAGDRVQYNGDGSTTAFSVSFVFWDNADLRVILTVDSTGVETVWTLGTQYNLSGGSGATGTLTVVTSPTDYTPASGETLTIKSNLGDVQNLSLPAGGPLPSAAVEEQLDKMVRLIQQRAEELGRVPKLSETSSETGITFDDLKDNAAKVAVVDAAETGIEWKTLTDGDTLTTPVALAKGGTNADLSTPTAQAYWRVNAGATAMEQRTKAQTADDLAAGANTIWVPATAMRPSITAGCAPLVAVETTALRPDMQVLDYDASVDEHAQFSIAMPSSWNEGTITFRGFWTVAAAVTTGIAIALQGVAVANDNTIDVVYGTAVVVTDDALNAAEDLMATVESGAITIAGAPVAGELCFFQVFRDISDGNDDMTQDMRLIGIQIIYTVDEAFDT